MAGPGVAPGVRRVCRRPPATVPTTCTRSTAEPEPGTGARSAGGKPLSHRIDPHPTAAGARISPADGAGAAAHRRTQGRRGDPNPRKSVEHRSPKRPLLLLSRRGVADEKRFGPGRPVQPPGRNPSEKRPFLGAEGEHPKTTDPEQPGPNAVRGIHDVFQGPTAGHHL
jgi:hypothetical protein